MGFIVVVVDDVLAETIFCPVAPVAPLSPAEPVDPTVIIIIITMIIIIMPIFPQLTSRKNCVYTMQPNNKLPCRTELYN